VISQAGVVVQAAGARGVLISSGASRAMELRGAYDTVNLATFFQLSTADAKAAMTTQCAKALAHGAARRTYKGVVQLEDSSFADDAVDTSMHMQVDASIMKATEGK